MNYHHLQNQFYFHNHLLDEKLQGFEHLKNAIQPEAKLASLLAVSNEYKFLISTSAFGFAYEKKWRSQLVTSVRLLFPLLYKQVAMAIMALIDLLILLLPFAVLANALFMPLGTIHAVALLLCVASLGLYGMYAKRVWRKGWVVGMVLWPLLLVQEFCLVIASVIKYKRKSVTWKGRVIRPEVQS